MKHGAPSDPGYHLPIDAHAELQALRDHLHLLAQLSIPEHENPDALVLPRAGLPTASSTWPTPPTASSRP